MASPVYSTVLWEYHALVSGSYASDLVPDGFIWVVRSVVAECIATPALPLNGFSLMDDVSIPIAGVAFPYAIAARTYVWQLHQAVGVGGNLSANAGDSDWKWRVSGFQLTLP